MIKKRNVFIGLCLLGLSISYGQNLTTNQIELLRKNAIDIHVDSLYENGNWDPFLKQIENKQIVLLGEFNHGSKEVFTTRNSLIKSLHNNLGFDVILFESGIGELAAIDIYRNKMNSSQMTLGFFGGWRTVEFKNLMSYIKDQDISIGGFDVQRFGSTFEKFLETNITDLKIDVALNNELEKRFGVEKKKLSNKKIGLDSVENSTVTLIKDYKKLQQALINVQSKEFNKALLLIKQTITNRISFLTYQLDFKRDNNWSKRWEARDLAMAKNIEWLIETFYSNRKIIIIGHNFHIARFNDKEAVMGSFLEKKLGASMYSVGVFAKTGSYKGNYGNTEKLNPPEPNQLDIKNIIGALNGRLHFLDIHQQSAKELGWLFNDIIVNDTFIDLSGSNKMILSKHFDGLLLLDKVSVPQDIKWN